MTAKLSLTADSTIQNDLSHLGYAIRTVNESPLDNTIKAVYLQQLRELQATLAACHYHSVEHFVAKEEMKALESDFWMAVDRVRWEQQQQQQQWEQQRQQLAYEQSESAKLWQNFRRSELDQDEER